tara:strand:- start:1682 stop:1798 length:117 start_codon:yes stop_codon:yes gene_type:complete
MLATGDLVRIKEAAGASDSYVFAEHDLTIISKAHKRND